MEIGETVDFYPPEAKTHQEHYRAVLLAVTPKCVRVGYESKDGRVERLTRQTNIICGQAQLLPEQ